MPRKKLSTSFIFWLVLAKISILAVDQYLKFLSISQERDFFIWSRKAGFVFNINPDIAFNIQIPRYGFVIALTIFLIFFTFQYIRAWQAKEKIVIWAFGILLVGAISNLLDRFIYGHVIDYLYFAPRSYFNLADIAIVVGVLMFGGKIFFWRLRGLFKRKSPESST